MKNKRILHVDLDAFFASVEQLDYPTLRGKPVIVGGSSDRGVVSTCSYEARKFGVHSAMSVLQAKKLCPKGVFVKGRMERYIEISKEVFSILETITTQIERVSIDEAYLDITEVKKPSYNIAIWIKNTVYEKIGITISIGISYNKFLAKLASDWNKPNGIFEIKKKDVPDILKPLPIGKIHGLGKKTSKKLNNIGIYTIADLMQYNEEYFAYFFGKARSREIYERIRGIDQRPVKSDGKRKSISRETTFMKNIDDRQYIKETLLNFLFEINFKLVKEEKTARTLTIKIKYEDFKQITKSHSLSAGTNNKNIFEDSLENLYSTLEFKKKVRLAGISLSNLEDNKTYQLSLFD